MSKLAEKVAREFCLERPDMERPFGVTLDALDEMARRVYERLVEKVAVEGQGQKAYMRVLTLDEVLSEE